MAAGMATLMAAGQEYQIFEDDREGINQNMYEEYDCTYVATVLYSICFSWVKKKWDLILREDIHNGR